MPPNETRRIRFLAVSTNIHAQNATTAINDAILQNSPFSGFDYSKFENWESNWLFDKSEIPNILHEIGERLDFLAQWRSKIRFADEEIE